MQLIKILLVIFWLPFLILFGVFYSIEIIFVIISVGILSIFGKIVNFLVNLFYKIVKPT